MVEPAQSQQPVKTEGYTFTYMGGMIAPEGKPHWPNHLRFVVRRRDALEMACRIIRAYEFDPSATEYELPMMGELCREPGDDIQHS